jgi:hypothetical protein
MWLPSVESQYPTTYGPETCVKNTLTEEIITTKFSQETLSPRVPKLVAKDFRLMSNFVFDAVPRGSQPLRLLLERNDSGGHRTQHPIK